MRFKFITITFLFWDCLRTGCGIDSEPKLGDGKEIVADLDPEWVSFTASFLIRVVS